MEQYFMPGKDDLKNLRWCLDKHGDSLDQFFVRLVGSKGGTVKVNENMLGRKLDFKRHAGKGISFLVDGKEAIRFPLKSLGRKGFSLAYERFYPNGNMVALSHGQDPYDRSLPEPARSILRNDWDDHLVEISFRGRIHLKFHSCWNEASGWKYWAPTSRRPRIQGTTP